MILVVMSQKYLSKKTSGYFRNVKWRCDNKKHELRRTTNQKTKRKKQFLPQKNVRIARLSGTSFVL